MKYGCCVDALARTPDGAPVPNIEQLADLGYDYVELYLAALAALSEDEFQAVVDRLARAGIPCEACCVFYPRTVRLTGPDVDWAQVEAYNRLAIGRAARLGAKVIVFGSAGAKNVPEGFPYERAWAQIVQAMRIAAPIAEAHGITIVIEPLNKKEANIVLTGAEGLKLAREINRPAVQLLIDYYHMALEGESADILLEARDAVRHVHIASAPARTYPVTVEPGFLPFFANLKAIGYRGRVSVEARTDNFQADAAAALRVLKQLGG
ncbi:MAG: sugar phosphate isomerase/epimerase family protein [Anaerolineae bacterium]